MALTAISGFELFTRRAKIRRMEKKLCKVKYFKIQAHPTWLLYSTYLPSRVPQSTPRSKYCNYAKEKCLLSIDRKVSSIFPYSMSFFHSVWEHSRALSRPSKIYQGFLNSIIHKTTNILKSSIEFHASWTKLSILKKKKSRFLFNIQGKYN